MPATSKSQQRLFGMVYAYKKGKLDLSTLDDSLAAKIKEIADGHRRKTGDRRKFTDGISMNAAKDYAKTKHSEISETHIFTSFDMFCESLNENIDYKSNQVLIDLYNKFNDLYFDSALPTNIKIGWINSKHKGGVVKSLYYRSERRIDIQSLSISNYRPLTEDKLNGLMLHEMIHVYLLNKGIAYTSGLDKYHGYEFKEKIVELQNIVDFTIPLVETDDEISDHVVKKTFDVLMLDVNNKHSFTIFPKGFLSQHQHDVLDKYENYMTMTAKTKSCRMLFIETDYEYLNNLVCRRNLNGFKLYIAEDDLYENIIKGKVFFEKVY